MKTTLENDSLKTSSFAGINCGGKAIAEEGETGGEEDLEDIYINKVNYIRFKIITAQKNATYR